MIKEEINGYLLLEVPSNSYNFTIDKFRDSYQINYKIPYLNSNLTEGYFFKEYAHRYNKIIGKASDNLEIFNSLNYTPKIQLNQILIIKLKE